MAEPTYLADLLAALNFLILERIETGQLRVIGVPPEWAARAFPFLGDLVSYGQLAQHVPFLGHFLPEAEGFWQLVPSGAGRLTSGIWTETDQDGVEHPLEAFALRVAGHNLMVIQSARTMYKEKQQIIQTGREARLRQERPPTPPEGLPRP
jgi:hypothetical protein